MTEICQLLEWDSQFFGKRIARLQGNLLTAQTVQQAETWCRGQRVDCLYFLAGADDPQTIRLAEEHDFNFVDVRLTFEHPLKVQGEYPHHPAIRLVQPGDLGQLRQIARGSYRMTRFYFDQHFNPVDADRLYETWIEKSCSGYAQAVLVFPEGEKILGFITCHLDGTHGQIGLVGVAETARGKGVGVAVVEQALAWFTGQGASQVDVVTQGRNLAAQRLYQRCGFLTGKMELWYHRWFQYDVEEAS